MKTPNHCGHGVFHKGHKLFLVIGYKGLQAQNNLAQSEGLGN